MILKTIIEINNIASYLVWKAGMIKHQVKNYKIDILNITWLDNVLRPFLTKKYMQEIIAYAKTGRMKYVMNVAGNAGFHLHTGYPS